MDLNGQRDSDNVEDARGQSSSGGGFGGGGGGGLGLLMTIGRIFGIKGILVALIAGMGLWYCGILDPSMLIGGSPAGGSRHQVEVSPQEEAKFQQGFKFVKKIVGSLETVWTDEFARHREQYPAPKVKTYSGQIRTACGPGSAAMGPFYCPGDQVVYIDLSFYDELAKTFNSPGDFAQAYVLAHEVGHHVQKLLGTSDKVAAMQGRPDYNEYSVRLELQADYYAGVWANHAHDSLKVDSEDIEEAMRAANAIGDDAIQKKQQGKVVPHSFTHGTSAQRMKWFNKGLQSGTIEGGDTFAMPYSQL